MKNLSATEIQSLLVKYAKADVGLAKRRGAMAITDTKRGNVELTYNHETNTFTAANFNHLDIVYKSEVSAKEMIEFVAGIYIVE